MNVKFEDRELALLSKTLLEKMVNTTNENDRLALYEIYNKLDNVIECESNKYITGNNKRKYLYELYYSNNTVNCERFIILYMNKEVIIALNKNKQSIRIVQRYEINDKFESENWSKYGRRRYYFDISNFDKNRALSYIDNYKLLQCIKREKNSLEIYKRSYDTCKKNIEKYENALKQQEENNK